MKIESLLILLMAVTLSAQTSAPDPWKSLAFLEGTWDAKTSAGTAAAASAGAYTFRKELGGHILARHSTTAGCKAPADYDCEHRDLLYIYNDAPGQALKAIYFDSEGHVLHYDVSSPAPNSVVLLSPASAPGPQFRLTYDLKGSVMSGKFQMRMPGAETWNSYLEWSGSRK